MLESENFYLNATFKFDSDGGCGVNLRELIEGTRRFEGDGRARKRLCLNDGEGHCCGEQDDCKKTSYPSHWLISNIIDYAISGPNNIGRRYELSANDGPYCLAALRGRRTVCSR